MKSFEPAFQLPLPGLVPLLVAATGQEAIVLVRGRQLFGGSQAAPWDTFELRLLCFDLARQSARWEHVFDGPDTGWRLDRWRGAVLLWDELAGRLWRYELADGARRELLLPPGTGASELLAMTDAGFWFAAERGLVRLTLGPDEARLKVAQHWRCGEWLPTASCVENGVGWAIGVAGTDVAHHALLRFDPAGADGAVLAQLSAIENVRHLRVLPDGFALFGFSPGAATLPDPLPPELTPLVPLSAAANRPGLRGVWGKLRLYRWMLSDFAAFMRTMGALHETARAVCLQAGTLTVTALSRDGAVRWQRPLHLSHETAVWPATPPTVCGGQLFIAGPSEVWALDAATGQGTAQSFGGAPLALLEPGQPFVWIREESKLAAWRLNEA